MTIQSFNVSNGPIQEAICEDVPNLMIIAGPNGVGKSTLLETLFANLSGGRGGGNVAELSEEALPVYYSPHRAPVPASVNELYLAEMSDRSFRDVLSERGGYNAGGSRSAPSAIRGGNWSRSRSHADAAPYFEVKRRLTQLYVKRSEVLNDVYQDLGRVPEGHIPDTNEPLKEAVRAVLPGIEFQGIEKEESQSEYRVLFENRTGDEIEFDDLSSGEKDVISLLFLLVEEQIERDLADARGSEIDFDNLILLIDGPESYLHPQLQLNFLEYVREYIETQEDFDREVQILMCTHSQMILEHADSDELYLLVYPDQREGNQLVSIDNIEMDLFRSITGELGTAALSTGNPLLLVEGKTDREILRQLYPNIEDDITIVPMGGKQEIVGLDRAFDRLLPELLPAGIEPFALIDRDRDSNSERDVSDRIFMIPATCMENLLLHPEGLFEALDVLAGNQALNNENITAPSDIQDLFSEIIQSDELFQHELQTRLNEKLTINTDSRNASELEVDAILSELDEVVNVRKDRLREEIPDIKSSVQDAIDAERLDDLDGKYILGEIGSRFTIQRHHLARTTADKLQSINEQPRFLNEVIEEIGHRPQGRSD